MSSHRGGQYGPSISASAKHSCHYVKYGGNNFSEFVWLFFHVNDCICSQLQIDRMISTRLIKTTGFSRRLCSCLFIIKLASLMRSISPKYWNGDCVMNSCLTYRCSVNRIIYLYICLLRNLFILSKIALSSGQIVITDPFDHGGYHWNR